MVISNATQTFKVDKTDVEVYTSEVQLGQAAASFVCNKLQQAIDNKDWVNLILATGASQISFIEALKNIGDIDWRKVRVFHLDEYIGLDANHPASFSKYLKDRILDEVKPGEIHFINGNAENVDEEVERYEQLLKEHPADVTCIGIGENGHIAFNDPGVADFSEDHLIKLIQLKDEICRNQQVKEDWFHSADEVPQLAITITIPGILKSNTISCVVPYINKKKAVYNTLKGPVTLECPASILRKHRDVTIFLDQDSSSLLE